MGVNLCIDVGNTRTKVGEFEGSKLVGSHTFSNEEVINNSMMLDEMDIHAIILSSVNKKISAELQLEKRGFNYVELSHTTPLPVKILYNTPETLGKDRIALAVGAFSAFPNTPVLVIDAGTCVTYDFVNQEGVYLGGAISPGIQMRLKAMHFGTDSLPLIQWDPNKLGMADLSGKSTISSMLSGVVNGLKGEIESFIVKYSENRPDLKIFLTGGDAEFFVKELKNGIFADPNLLLKGLNEILRYNLHK